MKTVLVTGGAGFVGSHLAIGLRQRWPQVEVVALDNLRRRGSETNLPRLRDAGVRFVHGDIRNPEDFETLPPADFLLECSAEPSVLAGYGGSPRYVLNTNFLGTVHCLEYARQHGTKVIFFSTSRVYPIAGLNQAKFVEEETRFAWTDEQRLPGVSSRGVTEEFSLGGARSLYGMTKLAAEMLLEEYAYAYGLRYVVNRCGVLAGPWQMGKSDQGILAFWVIAHLAGRPLQYLGFGGAGKQVRDFLHVADLTDLVCEQLERFEDFEGEVYNVGGGRKNSLSLCELTDLCHQVIDRTVPVAGQAETRLADVRVYLSDCTRLFSRTSWRPRIDARQTVANIADWARPRLESLCSLT